MRECVNSLYGRRWRKLRRKIIARDLCRCRFCGVIVSSGRSSPNAAEVDHIIPHRGDEKLFWDETNLQTLCKNCHGMVKQRRERSGRLQRSDGW